MGGDSQCIIVYNTQYRTQCIWEYTRTPTFKKFPTIICFIYELECISYKIYSRYSPGERERKLCTPVDYHTEGLCCTIKIKPNGLLLILYFHYGEMPFSASKDSLFGFNSRHLISFNLFLLDSGTAYLFFWSFCGNVVSIERDSKATCPHGFRLFVGHRTIMFILYCDLTYFHAQSCCYYLSPPHSHGGKTTP